ncbi:hypothetical protein N7495_001808 [Penicillium taxi]|uniref:uncharacterized protein n=1 Tax=Penicillium taxi TaxID=168475 RepID=UPI0025455D53|nr:uncharacterized protein N7495_001808 [Penicillium taxi]KAJ5909126.1 hypothetical protein N7495_001808 [Penicillium taxi]
MSTGNLNPLPPGLVDPLHPTFPVQNLFPSEFLPLTTSDEEQQLWGLSPSNWDSRAGDTDAAAFASSSERDLKNAQVRNGQPTPPPYEDPPRRADASRRRREQELKTAAESLSPNLDGPLESGKRAKFLERNRLAASKCRLKKKEHTQKLEFLFKEESKKKELLLHDIARLKSELLTLKNEVLKHAQCGDEPIKLHLAQMVKRITDTDTDAGAGSMFSDISVHPENPTSSVYVPTATISASASGSGSGSGSGSVSVSASTTATSANTHVSFGFDDSMLAHAASAQAATNALEQHLRRTSDSLASESSYGFSADDTFDDLINV